MKDMTHRHEYYNLMREIPIYDGKNETSRLVITNWKGSITNKVKNTN